MAGPGRCFAPSPVESAQSWAGLRAAWRLVDQRASLLRLGRLPVSYSVGLPSEFPFEFYALRGGGNKKGPRHYNVALKERGPNDSRGPDGRGLCYLTGYILSGLVESVNLV